MTRLNWPAAYELSCSRDGRLMGAVGRNVVVVDLEQRERISTTHPISHPSSCTFSPNSAALAVKATNGRIVVLSAQTGAVLKDYGNKNEGEGSNLACSADGDCLVDGSWDGSFTVRQMLTGRILSRDEFPGEMITRVTHDELARTWVVEHQPKVRAGENMPAPGYLSVIEWPFISLRAARVLSFNRHLKAATVSPDGRQVCFLDRYREELCVARVEDAEILASAPLQLGGTGNDFAWSTDARFVGAVAHDGFKFFRATDLATVGHFHAEYPSSIVFHPDGHDVLLGTWKRSSVEQISSIF